MFLTVLSLSLNNYLLFFPQIVVSLSSQKKTDFLFVQKQIFFLNLPADKEIEQIIVKLVDWKMTET